MHKAEYCFGIVGAGNIARFHAEAISRMKRARLTAVTAVPFEAAQCFSEEYGIKSYPGINEMLADPEIDVITICTPSGLHAEQAIKSLMAGKHVIVEKPLAISLNEADAIIEAVNRTGMKLGVISQRRFDSSVIAIKSAIENGVFGKLAMINGHVHYYREPSYYSSSNWRGTWEMDGGGALMNQGIHAVDLTRWFGGPVKSIYANAKTLCQDVKVEDTLVASLEFTSGALGSLEATTCAYPGLSMRVEIIGYKGTVILENSNIVYWQTESGTKCPIPDDNKADGSGAGSPMGISEIAHAAQFEDFIDAIENNGRPAVDGVEGRKAIEVVLAAYASSRLRQRVELPLRNN